MVEIMASIDERDGHSGTSTPNGTDVQPALTSIPLTEDNSLSKNGFTPLITVVGFHHARGPEVESWFGAGDGIDPSIKYDWPLLPFMALSDGAHA